MEERYEMNISMKHSLKSLNIKKINGFDLFTLHPKPKQMTTSESK